MVKKDELTPAQLKLCDEDGIAPFTQEEREAIDFAGNQLVMRVVAEIIKRLPEKDKNEIITLIEGHRNSFNKDNAIPAIGNDKDFDLLSTATATASNEFLDMIRSPGSHLAKDLKR
ncbi:hypothetical protein SRCM100623_02792 [Acetobacter pasteurianus]|uniref:Uncharacterized protein n=1 Tax=Acetobacter pasteurianus TaxID=438 RepID=A0A1A0CEA3_ACEPA|nr:hypothetical protein [Acetobacter pasteurianus]OAZ61289.1 hypothetical protein SRCM100623_02792 [Acetobacter pasteurianus]